MVWYILGVCTLLALQYFYKQLKAKNIEMTWYLWAMVAAWYGLLVLGADLVALSIFEDEPRAATIFGMIFGGLCLVTLPVLRKLINNRQNSEIVA